MTHYDTLGVSPDVTPSELGEAYRAAIRKTHPDRPGGSLEAAQEVNRAYEVLKDPQSRAAYDAETFPKQAPEPAEKATGRHAGGAATTAPRTASEPWSWLAQLPAKVGTKTCWKIVAGIAALICLVVAGVAFVILRDSGLAVHHALLIPVGAVVIPVILAIKVATQDHARLRNLALLAGIVTIGGWAIWAAGPPVATTLPYLWAGVFIVLLWLALFLKDRSRNRRDHRAASVYWVPFVNNALMRNPHTRLIWVEYVTPLTRNSAEIVGDDIINTGRVREVIYGRVDPGLVIALTPSGEVSSAIPGHVMDSWVRARRRETNPGFYDPKTV